MKKKVRIQQATTDCELNKKSNRAQTTPIQVQNWREKTHVAQDAQHS